MDTFSTDTTERTGAQRRRWHRVALVVAPTAAAVLLAGGISAGVGLSQGPGGSHPAAHNPSNVTILKISAPAHVRAGSTVTTQVTVRTHLGVPVVSKINWGDGTQSYPSTLMRCPPDVGGSTATLSFPHRWTRAGHYTVTVTASAACNSWRGHPNKAVASHSVHVVRP